MSKNLNGSFFTSKNLNGNNDIEINKLVAQKGIIDDISCNNLDLGNINVNDKFFIIDNSINILDDSINSVDVTRIELSLNILDISVTKLEISFNSIDVARIETSINILDVSLTAIKNNKDFIDLSCANIDISINANINNLIASNLDVNNDLSCNKLYVNNIVQSEDTTTPQRYITFRDDLLFRDIASLTGRITSGFNSNCIDLSLIGFIDGTPQTDILLSTDTNTHSYINTGANFGIGTNNPTFKLEVVGDIKSNNINTTDLSCSTLNIEVENNDDDYLVFRDNVGDVVGNIKSGIDTSQFPSAHFLDISFVGDYSSNPTEIFLSTSKEKATYLDVSFVGIGTKTPTNKLEVLGDIKSSNIFVDTSLCIGSTADRVYSFEVFGNSKFAVNTSDSTYLEIGNLKSSSDTLQVNSFGNVDIICDCNGNSSNKHIYFKTNGRQGVGETELMRIDDTGAVKIDASTTNDTALLYVGGVTGANGVIQVVSTNSNKRVDGMAFRAFSNSNNIINFVSSTNQQRGQIKGHNATSVRYQTSSDERLKKNIENMDNQLNNIMMIKPRKYDWIENNETDYGFVAQEIHKIYPNMMDNLNETYCKDTLNFNTDYPCDASGQNIYYGLDYGLFTPYIIKAFQEYKTITDISINELEKRLLALENI